VYDKTVRRRRAVLVLLVVLSLILLTAYFGEAPGGRLHGVQRGFLTVITPIQDGANKALKPVRDLVGWFGDTLHAKHERDQLRKQVEKLRQEVVAERGERQTYDELIAINHLDNQLSVANYRPVSATVIATSPSLWYSTVTIDRGESDGVRVNDPVINGEGLVGKITLAAPDGAYVSLITDSSVGVSARISPRGAVGILQPKVGDPSDLLLQYLPSTAPAPRGAIVVTSGTVSSRGDSLFPPGIPIGEVTSENTESAYRSVNVHPLANLHNLDVVQVLTAPPGSRPANLARLAASLPAGQGTARSGSAESLASVGGGG
jgi:rod shape-determining protein MreC